MEGGPRYVLTTWLGPCKFIKAFKRGEYIFLLAEYKSLEAIGQTMGASFQVGLLFVSLSCRSRFCMQLSLRSLSGSG